MSVMPKTVADHAGSCQQNPKKSSVATVTLLKDVETLLASSVFLINARYMYVHKHSVHTELPKIENGE